jgi:hypothetical protein
MQVIDQDGVYTDVPFMRTQYNYDTNVATQESALRCEDASLTQQQFKEDSDINVIIERFGVTGNLPIVTTQPMAGDFTGVEDFQTAVQAVREAEANFMTLPAKIRERFGQDSQKFVDFCVDPANIEAVREMGLAPKPPAPPVPPEVK